MGPSWRVESSLLNSVKSWRLSGNCGIRRVETDTRLWSIVNSVFCSFFIFMPPLFLVFADCRPWVLCSAINLCQVVMIAAFCRNQSAIGSQYLQIMIEVNTALHWAKNGNTRCQDLLSNITTQVMGNVAICNETLLISKALLCFFLCVFNILYYLIKNGLQIHFTIFHNISTAKLVKFIWSSLLFFITSWIEIRFTLPLVPLEPFQFNYWGQLNWH